MEKDFSIHIATVNGSGSQSANTVLVRSLFRMGLKVGGKNLFPSNIAGLPTWFTIRINSKGFISRTSHNEIVIAMNADSFVEDYKSVKPEGYFIYNSDLKVNITEEKRTDIQIVPVSFREIVDKTSDSVKMKKLLTNMAYVGLMTELLDLDVNTVETTIRDQFKNKESAIEPNLKAFEAGRVYARENLGASNFKYKVKSNSNASDNTNANKILIDGNSASALGLLAGGCTFMAWYPITPSSSLAESFEAYSKSFRLDNEGKNKVAVIQAEDELSAINMVIGAGWAGARSVTTTSGPGVSLMAEAAGLSYFAEIPSVIWNVQRAGPSTGLPTRTLQGDLKFCRHLSHGDTEHVVLLPSTPQECFDFGQISLDLSEQLQTLVIVLSDLDIGMNLWICDEFKINEAPYNRGKVLSAEDLNERENFARYQDVDGDGIPYRTIPGTPHVNAAYFTRGTGHTETSAYSENNEIFKKLLERLKLKTETAKKLVPVPVYDKNPKAKTLLIAYGSTDAVIPEVKEQLLNEGIETSYLRVRALPLNDEMGAWIKNYDTVYVVEQNRDGQLWQILKETFDVGHSKLKLINQFDGLPLEALYVSQKIISQKNLNEEINSHDRH